MDQYAFFASPGGGEPQISGGLEDGIDAPPPEENAIYNSVAEDYSLLSLINEQPRHPVTTGHSAEVPHEMPVSALEDTRRTHSQQVPPQAPQLQQLPQELQTFYAMAGPRVPHARERDNPSNVRILKRDSGASPSSFPGSAGSGNGDALGVNRQQQQHQRQPQHQQAQANRPAHHWYSSSVMTKAEIDTLLRIQWSATHGSRPYLEDYCYLAHLKKRGDLKGKFSPIEVFESVGGTEQVGHLDVEGLGKIPLRNIRRPKPMMDIGDGSFGGVNAAAGTDQKTLDEEPLLAARLMIEDGMSLLLDVDDIDRIIAERDLSATETEQLTKRREMLAESIADSFHLPESTTPVLQNGEDGDDSVLLYLAHLRKGQKLISRFLRSCVDHSHIYTDQVVWCVLRNMKALFESACRRDSPMAALAEAVSNTIRKMEVTGVCQCMAAFLSGDCSHQGSELPLNPQAEFGSSDLFDSAGHILFALLASASELGLGMTPSPASYSREAVPDKLVSAWNGAVGAFFNLLKSHLSKKLTAMKTAKSDSEIEAVQRQVPVEIIRAMLPHANTEQRQELRSVLVMLS